MKKNSPVIQKSTAKGVHVKDPLQKLLPPTDQAISDELEFWLMISKEF